MASSSGEQVFLDAVGIQAALDGVLDHSIVFHAYAAHMRDYDVVVHVTADPRTGIAPKHVRLRFTHCVRADARSAVEVDVWSRSLDERLTDYDAYLASPDLDGYVWGVKYQVLYPGARLVESDTAREWAAALGIAFHTVRIETNGHDLTLVFSSLRVEVVAEGWTPFVTPGSGADCEMPLP